MAYLKKILFIVEYIYLGWNAERDFFLHDNKSAFQNNKWRTKWRTNSFKTKKAPNELTLSA